MLPGSSQVLTEEEITRRLNERRQALEQARGVEHPAFPNLRPAAVLVPLVWLEDQWHLLFTRRAETVNSHKGQVSFPGGGAEPADLSPEDTALRETFEETGLLPEDVRILGRLYSRPTISSYLVTPLVGRIRWPYEFRLSALEVSRIFTIPLAWLADHSHWEERPFPLRTGLHESVIYYQPYDGEILWGASARITLDLLQTLQLVE